MTTSPRRPVLSRISPATLSVNEGDAAGTTTATFTVSRTGGSDGAVSVNFATADGTTNPATAGSDYTANSGTVNFADGDTVAKTITVSIIGDTVDEANETFTVGSWRRPAARVGDLGSECYDYRRRRALGGRYFIDFTGNAFGERRRCGDDDGDLHGESNGRQRRNCFGQLRNGRRHVQRGHGRIGLHRQQRHGDLPDGDTTAKTFTVSIIGNTVMRPTRTSASI